MRAVVRRFGSNTTHVADVDVGELVDIVILGAPAAASSGVVTAACGAHLRPRVVVMKDASVACRPCVHVTSVSEVRR